MYGLGNYEGNHGEDVKELYYHIDNIPTHYYMEYLYKYPQQKFPYELLLAENRKRSREEPEYEILDTGIFDNNEYFDVRVTYAKQSSKDVCIKIDIHNHHTKAADITVMPTLWFYNRWMHDTSKKKPSIELQGKTTVKATHHRLGTYYLYFQPAHDVLFTENETNFQKVNEKPNASPFTKEAFHKAIIKGEGLAELRKKKSGTKFSPVYKYKIEGQSTKTIYLRLTSKMTDNPFHAGFDSIFTQRKEEADTFYDKVLEKSTDPEWKKCSAAHWPACCGANNIITTMWSAG